MTEKKKLKIKIFDKEYSLLVENEDVAKELAVYVNQMMDDTQKELPNQPAQTIAVIAALNIAFDYFIEKDRNRKFLDLAAKKVKNIQILLDKTVPENPAM